MSEHRATIVWRREGEGDFSKGHYSREHVWRFDGGVEVAACASPSVVRAPWSTEAAVDPEEAFVAALSACHMLTFIDIARHAGFVVDSYDDQAIGLLTKNAAGRPWISEVKLNPGIAFSGQPPSPAALSRMHERAHEACFIANSVTSKVTIAQPTD